MLHQFDTSGLSQAFLDGLVGGVNFLLKDAVRVAVAQSALLHQFLLILNAIEFVNFLVGFEFLDRLSCRCEFFIAFLHLFGGFVVPLLHDADLMLRVQNGVLRILMADVLGQKALQLLLGLLSFLGVTLFLLFEQVSL